MTRSDFNRSVRIVDAILTPERYCTYCDKNVTQVAGNLCPDCRNRTWETGQRTVTKDELAAAGVASQ